MKEEHLMKESKGQEDLISGGTYHFVNRYGVSSKRPPKVVTDYRKTREGVANLDPKVNEPYEPIPRRVTREAMIGKVRSQFASIKIEELLRKFNIDFSDPNLSRCNLDLSHFDNKIYDIYPNELWLQKAFDPKFDRQLKVQAQCMFFNKASKTGTWRKVLIQNYDKITDTFSGHIDDQDKETFDNMPKIFTLFDAENPIVFAKRLSQALKLREYSESRIKYLYYLRKIPKYEVDAMPQDRMNAIINKAKVYNTKDFSLISDIAESEVEKINSSYIYTLNKMMFDDLYFNKKTPELCSITLNIPPEHSQPIPYYAKERLAFDLNFAEMKKAFSIKFVQCKSYVVDILHQIRLRNNQMIKTFMLYNTNITSPMKVEDFKKEQRKQYLKFKQTVENEEIGEIKKLLKKTECRTSEVPGKEFEINFINQKMEKKRKYFFAEEEEKEKYMEAIMSKINEYKTNNLITLINTIMHDSLYYLVCRSIIDFISFFEGMIPGEVQIRSTNQVTNLYDKNSELFPKIKNISKNPFCLEEDSAFGKCTELPDEDLNTTQDILNFSDKKEEMIICSSLKSVLSEGPYSYDDRKNTNAYGYDSTGNLNSKNPYSKYNSGGNSKFPIFHIFLKYKDNQFEYNYKIEDLVVEIKKLFDEGLDKIQKIPLISFANPLNSMTVIKFFEVIHRDKTISIRKESLVQGQESQSKESNDKEKNDKEKSDKEKESKNNNPSRNKESAIKDQSNNNLMNSTAYLSLIDPNHNINREFSREDCEWVGELLDRLGNSLMLGRDPLNQFLESFEGYKDYLNLVPDQYVKIFEDENGDSTVINRIRDDIINTKKLKERITNQIDEEMHVSYFLVNCKEIRETLLSKFDKIIELEIDLLIHNSRKMKNSFNTQCEAIKKEILKPCRNIDELVAVERYIDEVPMLLDNLKVDIDGCMDIYKILDEFFYKVQFLELRQRYMLIGAPTEILNTISNIKAGLQKQRERFWEELLESQVKLKEEIGNIEKKTRELMGYNAIENLQEASNLAKSLESQFQDCKEKSKVYNNREIHFAREPTDYSKIAELYKEFEPFYQIWTSIDTFLVKSQFYLTLEFSQMKGEEVFNMTEGVIKTLTSSVKKLKDRDAKQYAKIIQTSEDLKTKANEFMPIAKLAVCLTTEGMNEDRHWETLKNETGIDCTSKEGLSLKSLVGNGTLENQIITMAQNISEKAYREHLIKQKLEYLEARWNEVNFILVPYRIAGQFTLGGWGDIYAVLDEDVQEVQQLEMSQFKGVYLEDINNWTQSLLNITSILEAWRKFQQKWVQLQPIFESSDISKVMAGETKKFLMADKVWKELIKGLKESLNVKITCNKENLLKSINDSNILLEQVERGLNDFIEKKKGDFPRFYFISNEDLIEIISQTKDLNKIKDSLKKIFENIHYIDLKDEKLIIRMLSNLKEAVALKDQVPIAGKNVEVWMKDLENSMFATVKNCMDKAIVAYAKSPREEWVFDHPGQCITHASQLHWTSQVEEALNKQAVEDYIEVINDRIKFLVQIVRGQLNRVNSITISNLITLEVHNKEVTQSLVENNVNDMFSFEWIKQLRYYWEKNDCIVKSIQTAFPYGYEYLGNTEILVITPLTDKCYLTLMGALKFNMGGAPAGPAGTGKTESTKDLAKAIAKQCIVYNCSEETDFITVAKFFKGLACCGAWICFDEFNRINIEVLSVIAQQLIQLFGAKERGEVEINFEKSNIRILPTFCVFITMNPDYEGRTALPDNLIALFRPMAMMVPDYKLIAEVYLYSCGYLIATDLAKKIVSTFKLSSEQLSSQSHYDFGMRAVKSVLYAAKKLKRQNTDMPEDKLLLRALEDVNVPKFLSEDIPLFQSIIKDLFPNTVRPQSDLDDLIKKIKEISIRDNIQPTDNFIKKVIQLYDTIQVRHGLMIVGPTGGGKSSNWKTLQKALSELNDGQKFFKTETVIVNPKSIRKDQLYCNFDINLSEWVNGILPVNVISLNQDTSGKTKYWIMFDGPVDTLWIEDMNSVLDDSRKLCLSSSAIIVLNESITMMFEVEDLTHASPATVSRCGMVFMEPSAIGLLPIADSWINTIPNNLKKSSFDVKGKLKELFYTFLEDSVKFTRKKLKEPCPSTNNNLAESLMRILDCFLERYKEKENNKVSEIDIEILYKSLPQVYFFATVWSIGITCKEDGRKKFDQYLRGLMTEKYPDSAMPEGGFVYDYSLDLENDGWIKWESLLNYPNIDQKASYSDIIIPTIDSVRYSYLLKLLINNNKHVITTGPTGTGKTVNMMDVLSKITNDKCVSLILNFSAQTTAQQTQDTIDSKLVKKSRTKNGPKENKMIIFVDDLNMPKKEKYEAQPPIEIIRQWLDYEGWYDIVDKEKPFKNIVNIMFVGAMGPPGGGRSFLSNRFMRHFNLVTYNELVDSSIKTIFERKVNHFIGKFNEKVKEIIPQIVSSTLDLYKEIKSTLLPIPKTSHYLFNLRDMSKVLQGVCSASMKYTQGKLDLVLLWLHEMTRSFGDRLICEQDRKYLKDLLDKKIIDVKEFEVDQVEIIYEGVDKIIFCDFVAPGDKPYVQVTNIKQFISNIEEKLRNYNEEYKSKAMNLVMFLDACDHVARICRVIRQTGGHALLLGVGGSGRQSLARLSAYINEMECLQIEVNKNYKMPQFRENIKDILKTAGLKEKPISFLICDTQIFDEQMLEDLNNCLNSGDVPDIYKAEDFEQIKQACKMDVARKSLPETPTNLFNAYLQKVKTNLHLMIAMSPVGEMFVTRLRMFPSLVNCCTIDWFTEWPEEALLGVAKDTFIKNEVDLGSSLNSCIDTIKYIHKSVEKASNEYLQELRRYNYLTPTSFLEFLLLFQNILENKRYENVFNINRLESGLNVLDFAGVKIEEIEKAIKVKQPILEETTIKVNEFIKVLEVNKADADRVRESATIERANAEELNKEITELDEICTRELTKAQTELEISLAKIRDISDNDLKNIGFTKELNPKLKKIVELLLIFKHGDSFRSRKANLVKTDDLKNPWELNLLIAARNELNTTDTTLFKKFFYSFEDEAVRENLKNNELYKVKMSKEFIDLHQIDRKFVETGASYIVGCFEFILAMVEFCEKSLNVVDPLKKKAAEAKVKKVYADEALKKAETELNEAQERANKYEREYNEQVKLKNDLAFEISENQTKLERAKSLVGLLSGEKTRWAENVTLLKKHSEFLIGDCLIAAGMIAYSGAFTREFRLKLEDLWRKKLDVEGIKKSDNASLIDVMEDKLQTRKWNLNQLPNDKLSIENGIIMFKTRRWPLMIDPQNQASIFLKKFGYATREASFQVVKTSDPKMLDQVISGVKFGYWILLDNVGLSLDTSLEPILLQQKQPIKNTKHFEMRIGDKVIPYNDDFKLFMITTTSNPHYSPETFAKITIINFAITPVGLEDQMLSELVKIEMPELEENKNKILEENFKSQEILKEIEDKILDNLSKNKDNIEETLKSSDLIDILTEAKIKSTEIKEKMEESEKTRAEIDRKREMYRPSAFRASILFFTLLDIAFIDPMYQYSLFHFKKLFNETVRNLHPNDDILIRIKDINKRFTKDFYDFTCRSLFEKDKVLFSFVMSCKIIMGEQNESDLKITPSELRFLLAGPSSDVEVTYTDNPTNWISVNDWKAFYAQIFGMTRLHKNLENVEKFFMKSHKEFKTFYESPKNEQSALPEPLESNLTDFQKLLVIKAVRFDKLTNSLIYFVERNLGKEFTEPPTFDLSKSFKDSNYTIPLLFVLSTGSDPKNDFQQLADLNGRKVEYVSLGKSMDKIAVTKIEDTKLKGGWILLQNCHLGISFMPKLEDIIEQLQSNSTIDPNFRLWLTSMSSNQFSINVLKNSIKITMEPPKGLKLNLMRQYNNIREEDLEACNKPELFKSFFFSLCFFHAIVQDRRKFGPIGWNVKYDFTNEDLKVSRLQLKNFLEEYEDVPYKVLNYLGAEINYGGRVTDDKDQRLIKNILKSFLNSDLLNYDAYKFSESGTYFCPQPGAKSDYVSYIKSLPMNTAPEIFGLHDNAEIVTAQNEAFSLLETVLGMQPRTSSGSGKSVDQVVGEILHIIETNTPAPFDIEMVKEKYPTLYNESMNTVLVQEVYRYNTLLNIMKKQIKNLKKALSGRISMSDEMDRIATSLYNNQVPQIWIKSGFLSLKPLMSWVEDLKDRIKFFSNWIENGTPKAFCLPSKKFVFI